jgi:hypothetical protein
MGLASLNTGLESLYTFPHCRYLGEAERQLPKYDVALKVSANRFLLALIVLQRDVIVLAQSQVLTPLSSLFRKTLFGLAT